MRYFFNLNNRWTRENSNYRVTAKIMLAILLLVVLLPLQSFKIYSCNNDFNTLDSLFISIPSLSDDNNLIDENDFITVAFEQPEFPGGRKAFNDYIKDNLIYPSDAQKNGVQGGVLVSFIVEEDGSISNVEILRSLYSSLDKEAIRLVQQMPKWQQGDSKRRIKVVRLIDFSLKDESGDGFEPDVVDVSQIVEVTMDEAENGIIQGDDGIYLKVPEMPKFPGGNSALLSYLRQTQVYPEDALNEKIEGRVIVQFIVEMDGSIANSEVIHGLYPSLDSEALRVISLMPKWIPGKIDGQVCRVKYTVPVAFRLN